MAAAVFATALNNQNLVRALEVLLVALIWLFFLRVIRAVWVEVRPPRTRATAVAGQAPVAGMPPAPPTAPPSTGRGARNLRLRIVEPEESRGQVHELPDEVTVGRAAGCGVRVEDAYTSSIHARVFRRDGGLWVEDLGSTNGTWVNAQRVTGPTRIGRGDLVQVGGTVFEVHR